MKKQKKKVSSPNRKMVTLTVVIIIIGVLVYGYFTLFYESPVKSYQCKIGQRQGLNCYTQIETTKFYKCATLEGYSSIYLHEIADLPVLLKTEKGCVFQYLDILNEHILNVNDPLIEVHENNNMLRLMNPQETSIEICVEGILEYRFRRPIWTKDYAAGCMSDLEEVNAEIAI